jgi:hypothetical protein
MPDRDEPLWAILEARDAGFARLRAAHAEAQKELDARERVIREQADGLRSAHKQLQEQAEAIRAYRDAFRLLRPVVVVGKPVMRFWRWVRRNTIAPRVGVLHQYPPRELRVDPPGPPPSMPPPTMALVTPSYRQAEFIGRTIESVLAQGYPGLEYYVQDGGSADGTVAILERYAGRLSGWDSRSDRGQSEAINRGFARTRGEIMGWLNSDDLLLPGALACVGEYFARHPEVDAVYGHRILIDENDREIGRWMLPAHDDAVLSWADFVPQETLFWRRALWEKAGGQVDESFRFAMDWDLLVRFRGAGARFARIPRFLGGFRVHPQQKTSAGISEIGFREMDRIRERVLGRVPTRSEVNLAVWPYLVRHVAVHLGWRIRTALGFEA